MKTIYFIAAVLFLTSCQFQNIEITGVAPGMDGSTVSVLDANHKVIYGANVQGGKFKIEQQVLNEPGYYTLSISTPRAPNKHFGIYLEPGKYNIELSADKRGAYPVIHCSSKTQNDLSQYRHFTDSVLHAVNNDLEVWTKKMNDPNVMAMPDAEYQAIIANLKKAQDVQIKSVPSTLNQFASKYPKNGAIAHAMNNMYMESDAATYYKIFQKLDPAVKSSDDGKKVAEKLNILVNLAPGSIAPEFYGTTPDGKKVNVKDLHKKVIIVAFWRSGWSIMKDDHFALVNTLIPSLDSKKVGVIGVSFDTDRSKWLKTIKERGLNFTQVSDLKGDDSPNAKNWNTYMLPNYFILDGDGKVLYKDLSYQELVLSINEYMSTH